MPDQQHGLTPTVLKRFAAGRTTPEQRRKVLRHLVDECEVCRTWFRRHVWGFAAEAPAENAYDRAFARAEAAALRELARRHGQHQALAEQVDALPAPEREEQVRNDPAFASTDLSTAFVERSHQARWRDADEMLAYARLAVAAAEAAAARAGGIGRERQAQLNDYLARAWSQLGTAHRVRSEPLEAEDAFAVACHHLDEGSGDHVLRARLYRQLASLRRLRRQFQEAFELLQRAAVIYRDLGDPVEEAATLITQSIIQIAAGDPEGAVRSLRPCLEVLDPAQHLDLMQAATINLVRCYTDLGQPERADALWREGAPLFAVSDDALALLRWRWTRGLIDRELGKLAAAEAHLQAVREGFLARGLAMESAVISLDLATVYLGLGNVAGAARLVSEAIPIFQSLGWGRELLASLSQLARIAQDGHAALELLREASRRAAAGPEAAVPAFAPQD
ncbi:MAG TPA: tetratricopeptide repeat protein [Thermoanaerobaculia bacterium]|nr:tetratricopeptide repeat protein [Thermoanaerobaculia bacterium]